MTGLDPSLLKKKKRVEKKTGFDKEWITNQNKTQKQQKINKTKD